MSRTVSRGGSSKPSFQTAASQAREPSSGKASFTITRPADGASRVVVTAGAGSAASGANPTRQVILRGEDSSRSSNASVSATMRRITIETSADSGRQVVRAGTKRRSGDMGASTGSGLSLRRTVVNNAAMDAEGDDDNEQRMEARESTFKRGRFIIENNSAATAGRGRISAAVPLSANPLAAPAHLPGVQFSAVLASRIAQAAAERLAAARPITNAASGSVSSLALSPLPAAAAAVSPSPSVVPAAASARASPQPASPSVHVLLRNLAPSMTEKFVLKQVFPLYDVPHISLDKDPATGLCSGTGDVWFSSTLQAEEAVKLNQGQTFLMHQIRLSIIRDNEEQPQPMRQAPAVPAAVTQQSQWPQQPLSFRVPVGSAPVASQSKPVSASFPSAAAAAAAAPFAPAAPAASAAPTGATPSPLSHSLTNVGFVGVFGDADAHMADDSGEETVFNITNLRGTNYAAAASAGSYSPAPASQYAPSAQQSSASATAAAAAASRPKVLQLRPKSVVVSGAEAMAGVSASGRPSFTTTRNAPSVHNSSADSGWQPKTVVLAPRR